MNFYSIDKLENESDRYANDISQLYFQIEDIIKNASSLEYEDPSQENKALSLKSKIFGFDYVLTPKDVEKFLDDTIEINISQGKHIFEGTLYIYIDKKRQISTIKFAQKSQKSKTDFSIVFNSKPTDFSVNFTRSDISFYQTTKTLRATFVDNNLHSLEDKPAISFKQTSPKKEARHRENNETAYFSYEGKTSDFIQQSYHHGKHVDPQTVDIFKQRVKNSKLRLSQSRYQKEHPSKPKLFKKKSKQLISSEQDLVIDRKLLLEDIGDYFVKVKYRKQEVEAQLTKFEGIVEEEISSFYGQKIYDHENNEVVISKQLIENLGLHNLESIKQSFWDQYFVEIERKLTTLEQSLNGVLEMLFNHSVKPLGFDMANPHINIEKSELSFAKIDNWIISDDIKFGEYMQNQEGEVVIVNDGKVDYDQMKQYLTIEQTFQIDDLKIVLEKLKQDHNDLKIYCDTIQEHISILKTHMKETQEEMKLAILQHFTGEEKPNFFNHKLLNEY